MNERIQALMDQCEEEYSTQNYPCWDMEKFAELLIRECMKVTVNYPHPQTKLTAAEHIARHFGVEE